MLFDRNVNLHFSALVIAYIVINVERYTHIIIAMSPIGSVSLRKPGTEVQMILSDAI